jgi:membrane-associated protease RseP (regulator of RpoE activity)
MMRTVFLLLLGAALALPAAQPALGQPADDAVGVSFQSRGVAPAGGDAVLHASRIESAPVFLLLFQAGVPVRAPHPGGHLEKTAFIARGRLGVSIQTIPQGMASALGLPEQGGVMVLTVDRRGPAAEAGIKPGDVILRLNGRPVTDAEELAAQIGGREPGTIVRIGLWRNHETLTVRATLGFWTILSEPRLPPAGPG